MIDLKRILNDTLAECREDHVGLWSILWQVRAAGVAEGPERMETTLALVGELLPESGIVAGQFEETAEGRHVFRLWKISPEETVRRIRREWRELGREPSGGDIVWFTSREFLSDLIDPATVK
jgi:hypothetical protein